MFLLFSIRPSCRFQPLFFSWDSICRYLHVLLDCLNSAIACFPCGRCFLAPLSVGLAPKPGALFLALGAELCVSLRVCVPSSPRRSPCLARAFPTVPAASPLVIFPCESVVEKPCVEHPSGLAAAVAWETHRATETNVKKANRRDGVVCARGGVIVPTYLMPCLPRGISPFVWLTVRLARGRVQNVLITQISVSRPILLIRLTKILPSPSNILKSPRDVFGMFLRKVRI
jgi:hypothetical protein